MKTWTTKRGYKITRILSGISKVFLLSNNEINILIDTSPQSQWHLLNRRLKKLDISHIDFLILTHTHYDHSTNSAKIKEHYGAKIIVHCDEASYLANGDNIIPQGTNFLSKLIVKALSKPFQKSKRYPPSECEIQVETLFDLKPFGSTLIYCTHPVILLVQLAW
ncbi:MAG: MBL fold metallo-hydrolase [bacterium]